jgi:hypothetical protein
MLTTLLNFLCLQHIKKNKAQGHLLLCTEASEELVSK